MIDALIAGKLYGQAQQRTGASGKPFTVAKLRAAAGNGEALFVNVIAFAPEAQAALLAMDDEASVSLAGELSPKAWMDKQGQPRVALDLVAHAVLTPYHVSRKRQAVQTNRKD